MRRSPPLVLPTIRSPSTTDEPVQIGHPQLNATVITTTNVYVRDQLKVLMAVLALVGITGMYLSQIRRNGVLGLIGYVLLAAGYLLIMCSAYTAAWVLPEIATANPGHVNDVIVVDTAVEPSRVTLGRCKP